ncbi:MAG: hypothetical protein ABL865_06420, partial [Candidatus Nitrotoga sp.]
SIQERKASTGANDSNRAFQTASTGTEIVLQDIIKGGHDNTGQLAGCNISTGLIDGSNYKVELRDNDGNKIMCGSGADIAMVRNIKSVGTIGQNQRAVEVAVAGGPDWVFLNKSGSCPNASCTVSAEVDYGMVVSGFYEWMNGSGGGNFGQSLSLGDINNSQIPGRGGCFNGSSCTTVTLGTTESVKCTCVNTFDSFLGPAYVSVGAICTRAH